MPITDARAQLYLDAIADEAKTANDIIALNRDGQGQGRVRVATAMQRIALYATKLAEKREAETPDVRRVDVWLCQSFDGEGALLEEFRTNDKAYAIKAMLGGHTVTPLAPFPLFRETTPGADAYRRACEDFAISTGVPSSHVDIVRDCLLDSAPYLASLHPEHAGVTNPTEVAKAGEILAYAASDVLINKGLIKGRTALVIAIEKFRKALGVTPDTESKT